MTIRTFKHPGLQGLYLHDRKRGVPQQLVSKLRRMLSRLDQSSQPGDMDFLPGWKLHELTGGRKGIWSVTVSGNWRLTFRMEDGDAFDVDLEGHH